MVLWRISNHLDLDGLGGQRGNARWHTQAPGKRIVYLAEHPALALVEVLVNLKRTKGVLPAHFQLLKIESDSDLAIESVKEESLRDNWRDDLGPTQQIGNDWLKRNNTALLSVPSAPSPESANYLLNPLHPDSAKVKVIWARWVRYDRRLFRLSDESISAI